MNEQEILEQLLALLEANGVTVRNEPLGGIGGGLCTVKGKVTFFVDTQAGPYEVAALCAHVLPEVVDIENVYIKPEIRRFIENHTDMQQE